LVFPIIFSHEFENDPSSANTVPRKIHPSAASAVCEWITTRHYMVAKPPGGAKNS
jgi:hypothetical protein